MQVDAEGVHADECACEDEWDAARDNEPGAQSEREEADGEDDDDGEGQRLDKVVDGVLYDGGLVRYLVQLHAEREVLSELRGEFFEVFAEREDVAAVLHGDGDANGGCAVILHFRIGGVNRATRDVRNVAEAEYASVRRDGEGADVVEAVKDARDAQVHTAIHGLNRATREDGVLCAQGLRDGRGRDAEGGEAVACDLDVDELALDADQLDFLYARDGEDAAAHVLCGSAQLLVRVVLARDGVDGAVYVVKAVVVEWTDDAVRQLTLYILAEVAHVAPRRTDELCVDVVAQVDVDDGLSCTRLARYLL